MQGRTTVVVILLSLCSFAAQAASPCAQRLCWQVAPTVCLLDQQQNSCQLPLQLDWQSAEPLSACAYLNERKLQCWSASQQGQLQQQLPLTGPANLELRNMQQQVLLQQQLTVLSRQPERRRRLVAPWSVF
ncbi:DUF3019 domain-containing protein [Rheinheimera sp. 4Y26]|uniref:DUF3019 domain-containing protein n=1 Tax=Rheinheimera sp. 4Y26 TaxID=2977811 RepID=UPI0021B098C3|nr:DUF3019 domain-containing protein [Rheinheimera sp. 4Y26]MCT6698123.1 DUF3019 domain-containing protein [Rheinheimera sp. 4Y26]